MVAARPEDLTARARIREAAFRLFAAHGVEGTSLRAIAEEAGTSAALVMHHFGSKVGLVRAVDDAAVCPPPGRVLAVPPGRDFPVGHHVRQRAHRGAAAGLERGQHRPLEGPAEHPAGHGRHSPTSVRGARPGAAV